MSADLPHGGAPKRVVIIDDHGLVSAALVSELLARGYDARSCPVLDDDRIVQAVRELQPSVVLLDLALGRGRNSLSLIAPLKRTGAAVIILSAATDAIRLAECIEAGADALLSKGMRIDDVVEAIEGLGRRGVGARTGHHERLLSNLDEHRERRRVALAPFQRLTPREQEVLVALAQGKTADVIAKETVTSVRTVRGHIQSVLDKLGVRSQLAAVAKARSAGWQPNMGTEPRD